MPVVCTRDLRKQYGSIEALAGVSLSVESGMIYGLLGQNGAGKSTLVKILLGIVRKSAGEAEVFGEPAGTIAVRRRIGYLPEDHQFPGYHTAASLLDLYGQLYGLTRDERRRRAAEALDVVGLAKRKDSRIRQFSKGMKQRLGIAQAFFHDPEVIFLDEPTDGVDPVGRKEIRDLLLQLRQEGRTIFVNSHLLGEVEQISDQVAIMHQGQLIRTGRVADLTRQANRYAIGLAPGQSFPVEAIQQLGFPVVALGDRHEVEIPEGASIDTVLGALHAAGLSLRHLVETKQSLEDVFVKLVDRSDSREQPRAARVARPVEPARHSGRGE